MKNLKIFKSSFCEKLKVLIIPIMLLILGTGQMWGYETFKEVWVTYNTGGSDPGAAGSSDQSLGNVSQFVIKAFYLNCRDNWGAGRTCWNGGALYYSTDGGSNYTEVINNATTWKKDGWSEDDYQFRKESMSVTLISSTAASGNYTIKFKGKVWGDHDTWINSGNASTWTMSVLPPALSSFTITPTGAVAGSGTSGDPYIIPYGGDLTLVSSGGTKARTDANSSVRFSLNNSTWGTTSTYTTKEITNVTSTDVASVNLYAKCYNSTASLSGAVKTQTIYYRAAALNTITLNKGTGGTSAGEMTIREYATEYASYTAATKTNWSLKGYYTASSDGTQIIDKDGNLIANKSGYTNSSGQWIGGTTTLYAQWKQTYSVTYYANYPAGATSTSGSAPTDATEYSSGATVTVKTNSGSLAAGGYTFAGWNTQADGNGTDRAVNSTFSISANTQLYAKWTENLTTVTVGINTTGAGTLTVGGAAFTPGNTTTAGVATSRTVVATPYPGYRFGSWSKSGNAAGSASTNTYTLKGNGSGSTGTLTANFTQTYAYVEGRLTIYNSARSSETHVASSSGGWDKSSTRMPMTYDGTNKRFYLHTYKTPSELSAQQSSQYQWFSFKTSTVSGSLTSPQAFEPASNQEMTTAGSGNKKTVSAASTDKHVRFNSSVTNGYAILYFDESGVWYTLEHTLTYNGNGNTSGNLPASKTYYNNGASVTVLGNVAGTPLAKTNYTFAGWNTAQYITGTNYAAGNSFSISANTILYAKWTRSVTLDRNTATTGSTSVTATYNCATLPSITNPSKDGYTFGGWYTANDGSGSLVINTSGALQSGVSDWTTSTRFTRTADGATLYAKWSQTVTLDANTANHGSGSNKTPSVILNATALTGFSKTSAATGYHLIGFYTDATGGTKVLKDDGTFAATNVTDYITLGKWTKAGATTLYAHYEPNAYTIAFDPNDDQYVGTATGDMSGDAIAATYDVSYTLPANKYAREGYTFAGWATSPTGAVAYANQATGVSNLTSTNGGTATLYAKWTPKTYTVTFNARGGSGLSQKEKTVTMGATYGTLATVTPPAGKVFGGWYTSPSGGTLVESTTQVTTARDHTLYAHYVEKAQVYFKNTLGWSQVWVTYYAYWDNDHNPSWGAGNNGRIYHQMTQIAGTDIYYDDIPDGILSSWKGSIAFNSQQLGSTPDGDYNNFDHGQAVFRRDFDSDATMFVPVPNDPNKFKLNDAYDGTWYYSTDQVVDKSGETVTNYRYKNGYWVRYNNNIAGYDLKGSWNWEESHYIEKPTSSDSVYSYTIKNLNPNSTYYFKLYKHCTTSTTYSSEFSNTGTMTSNNCTDWTFNASETTGNAGITTTVAGDYTFNFRFSATGVVKLSVDYPLAVGDFRVRYNYTKGGAKTYYSEYIKARANGKDTISIFIHSGDSASARSITLEKCTTINASGVASWNTSYRTMALPTETASGKTSGVYNYIVEQNSSEEVVANKAYYWKKYDGNYYIRTASSDGGWDMYKYRTDNIMTLSEYSMTQTLSAPYSHYYCRHIGSTSTDISYAIATDYSPNISGTMEGDATIGNTTTLPEETNVRFSWNDETNALRRAYLKNAQGGENKRFLVLHGKANGNIFNTDGSAITADAGQELAANELLFADLGNWIYQVELKAVPQGAVSLIAKYNGADRYLIGGASSWMTIMGGTGSTKYNILAVYDFKTNRLMTVWTPTGDIKEALTDVDVLLLRHAQEAGQALTFNGGSLTTKKVYGALEFQYDELVGYVANWTSDSRPLMKFFISFPFDVNVSDIFGLNSAYGQAYIIQKYDGAERASKGFFRGDGTKTFWKNLTLNDTLKANVGYIVNMDNDYLNNDIGNIWENKGAGSKVYLYFPSAGDVGSISSTSKTISIPPHTCTINRTFETGDPARTVNHQNTDSHWNMMGVPIFGNTADGTLGGAFVTSGTDGDGNFHYFYAWDPATNQFAINTVSGYTFKSMHSYMVQYTGNVTFTGSHPAAVVGRRAPLESHQLELQVLNSDEEVINRTYVELRENACDTFALNEDVYMDYNNYAVNVFTLAGNYDVAANVLSLNNQTVQVGVEVRQAGTYIFSMPSNFSGTATLIDTFTGARTNLSISDYEVQLEKGVDTERFLLELDIKKATTVIDSIGGEALPDGRVRKVLIDGILYIVKDGKVFDARGARVQ